MSNAVEIVRFGLSAKEAHELASMWNTMVVEGDGGFLLYTVRSDGAGTYCVARRLVDADRSRARIPDEQVTPDEVLEAIDSASQRLCAVCHASFPLANDSLCASCRADASDHPHASGSAA